MSRDRLRATIADHGTVADAALLAAVPAALTAIFLLVPESTRMEYVLEYRRPTAVDMYISHFVHFGASHLGSNVVAYALSAVPAYVFCVAAGRRTDFLAAFGVVLAAFPFALSVLNALFVRPSIGYGFSGLAMAFLGFLPVGLTAFVRERLLPGVALDHASLLFFVGSGIIALLLVPASPVAFVGVVVAVVGVAVYVRSLWGAVGGSSGIRVAASRAGDAEAAATGVVVVLAAPFIAFPGRPAVAGDGYVLNVYSHFLGFCLGFLVPFVALRVADEVNGGETPTDSR